LHREKNREERTEPEAGNRDPDERQRHRGVIDEAAPEHCGKNPERYRNHDRDRHGAERQDGGVAEPAPDLLRDRLPGAE
jgi:hypothetical protein